MSRPDPWETSTPPVRLYGHFPELPPALNALIEVTKGTVVRSARAFQPPHSFESLIGRVFGALRVKGKGPMVCGHSRLVCKCDCGAVVYPLPRQLLHLNLRFCSRGCPLRKAKKR